MTREGIARMLGEHLAHRYIPFSSDKIPPMLDEGDAIGLAFVAIDWLIEKGELDIDDR